MTADFTGGDVTSDAGVLVLREDATKIGIIDQLTDAIADDHHQSHVKHAMKELHTQRIFQIACVYKMPMIPMS